MSIVAHEANVTGVLDASVAVLRSEEAARRTAAFLKRTLDLVVASVALVLALPVLAAAMILVKLTSPGPVLLRQQRVGRHGSPFGIFKIRTMIHGNDTSIHREYVASLIDGEGPRDGTLFKLVADPRVTRIGRILRKLSIDELPQLINVIRGEMSLVGPRPALGYEIDRYPAHARRRLDVKPGMTGLWQVSGRNTLDFETSIALDLRYVATWSPMLDLSILLRTPVAVFRREAA